MYSQYQFKANTATASVITSIFINAYYSGNGNVGSYGIGSMNQTVTNSSNNNYILTTSCIFTIAVTSTFTPEMFVTYTGGALNLINNATNITIMRIA